MHDDYSAEFDESKVPEYFKEYLKDDGLKELVKEELALACQY